MVRQQWNVVTRMVFATGAVSAVLASGCGRDVRKYAAVVCEEMRDSEVTCIRGQRGTDTLAPGLVASQLAEYNVRIAYDAMRNLGDARPGLFARVRAWLRGPPTCETTATRHGLSNERFIELDQEMRLRCSRGDEKACRIACCGGERAVQAMPTLPTAIQRGALFLPR